MNEIGKVLFLGKADDSRCLAALRAVEGNFEDVQYHLGEWGDPLPERARKWRGDLIIPYLSRWIVPAELLAAADFAAINFHPAPPEYPGIGCVNFALYEEAGEYGVTRHHMAAKVDTGVIIEVHRFPILEDDTVESLLERTYDTQLNLFETLLKSIRRRELPVATDEKWTRPPITRGEFNDLFKITAEMDSNEVARRVRAIRYRHWRPFIDVAGHRFVYEAQI